MWTIQKIVKKGDYLYAIVLDHPKRTANNYVLYHRAVMENFLGRLLQKHEVVHHIDGNKHNNDILNLELMHNSEHSKHHAKRGRNIIVCICPNCLKKFSKEKRQIKKGSIPKCSRKCNGEYVRKMQLGRL